MTDDALLAEIAAAPDDDRPRLVYADWLQERGDPRGELIATQCALARDDAADAQRLQAREKALLAEHASRWTTELRALLPRSTFEFRRGFVERIATADAGAFVAVAHHIFAAHPLVRALAAERAWDALAASEWALRLEELTVTPDLATTAATLARSPYLTRLRHLAYARSLPDADTVSLLATWPHPLETLAIACDGGMHQMASSPGNARTWQLRARRLVEGLAGCAHRATLRTLRLRYVPAHGLALALSALPRLERLALDHVDGVWSELGALPPTLVELDLAELAIAPIDAPTLLARTQLRCLRLSRVNADDDLAVAIATSTHARRLVRLDLSRNGITDRGAFALAASEHLGNLRVLKVFGNRLSDAGKQALRTSRCLAGTKIQLR